MLSGDANGRPSCARGTGCTFVCVFQCLKPTPLPAARAARYACVDRSRHNDQSSLTNDARRLPTPITMRSPAAVAQRHCLLLCNDHGL